MELHQTVEAQEEDTHCPLIEEVVEDIVGLQSLFPSLFVAEDEVNPLVEVGRHIVTLQGLWEERRWRGGKRWEA